MKIKIMKPLTHEQRAYLYGVLGIIDTHHEELTDNMFSSDSTINYRELNTTREAINNIIDAGGYYDTNIEWLNSLREIHNWYKVHIKK